LEVEPPVVSAFGPPVVSGVEPSVLLAAASVVVGSAAAVEALEAALVVSSEASGRPGKQPVSRRMPTAGAMREYRGRIGVIDGDVPPEALREIPRGSHAVDRRPCLTGEADFGLTARDV
jgi:hypothetical protein